MYSVNSRLTEIKKIEKDTELEITILLNDYNVNAGKNIAENITLSNTNPPSRNFSMKSLFSNPTKENTIIEIINL